MISVLQFNMRACTRTHTHTQMLRVMKAWRRGEKPLLRRNDERIAFTQYTPSREGVGQREIVEGQTCEGGRMSISSVEKNSASDRFWERHNIGVVVKRQMERKEDFEIRKSPLAEKTSWNGAKAITADSRGQWLQGCMDNKSPAWTEIVLENSRIIQMHSAHHACLYFTCLFCPSVFTKWPFTPHRLPSCHVIMLLNLHVIQCEHTACAIFTLPFPYRPRVLSPLPKLHLLSGCNDAWVW